MKRFLTVIFILLMLLASNRVLAGHKKPVAPPNLTHFLAFDLDKNDFKAYDNIKEIKVYVVDSDGVAPAVLLSESDDGTSVLLAPPALAKQLLNQDTPTDPLQGPSTAPGPDRRAEK